MTNQLVMLTHEEGMLIIPNDERVWCLLYAHSCDLACLCGKGFCAEGAGATGYKFKEAKRGGITCPDCLRIIRDMKAVRL
ncbi:hypothetical protein QQ39_06405 [Pragia fontium]|nr:hypothetical protein QQ39_06405 [Pragia fontium]